MRLRNTGIAASLILMIVTSVQAGQLTATVKARGDGTDWIGDDDDVPTIYRNGGGTATVAFDINALGRVERCHVVKTSGYEGTGDWVCTLLTRRARFVPGHAGTGTYTQSFASG